MTSDGRALVLSKVSEEQWLQQVITWAKRAGWLAHHVHDSRVQEWGTDAGLPDLILVHPVQSRCIFAELKAERGAVSVAQVKWITALDRTAGVECYVWRPSDEAAVKSVLGVTACVS